MGSISDEQCWAFMNDNLGCYYVSSQPAEANSIAVVELSDCD